MYVQHGLPNWWKVGQGQTKVEGILMMMTVWCCVGADLRDAPSSLLCECLFTSVRPLGPLLRQLQCKKDVLIGWFRHVSCGLTLLITVKRPMNRSPSELQSNKSVHLHAIQRHRVSNVSYNYVNQTNLLDWLIEMSIIKHKAVRSTIRSSGSRDKMSNQNRTIVTQRALAAA